MDLWARLADTLRFVRLFLLAFAFARLERPVLFVALYAASIAVAFVTPLAHGAPDSFQAHADGLLARLTNCGVLLLLVRASAAHQGLMLALLALDLVSHWATAYAGLLLGLPPRAELFAPFFKHTALSRAWRWLHRPLPHAALEGGSSLFLVALFVLHHATHHARVAAHRAAAYALLPLFVAQTALNVVYLVEATYSVLLQDRALANHRRKEPHLD